jgi:hypothetical protein
MGIGYAIVRFINYLWGVQPQVVSFFIFTMSHFDWPITKSFFFTTLDIPPNGSLHAQKGILEVNAFGPPI